MHLTRAIALLVLLAAGLAANAGAQQQAQPAQGQSAPQAAPAPAPQQSQPQQSRPAPRRNAAPQTVDLPPPTRIAEIPRNTVVLIAGVVQAPERTTFVLNDGNASLVINLGPTWRDLTGIKTGDRVRVVGQLDPYGTQVFRAGSVILDNGRTFVVPQN